MISTARVTGFHGMSLQYWIMLPDTDPTPRNAFWSLAGVSLAHVPGAIEAARDWRAELPGAGAGAGAGALTGQLEEALLPPAMLICPGGHGTAARSCGAKTAPARPGAAMRSCLRFMFRASFQMCVIEARAFTVRGPMR